MVDFGESGGTPRQWISIAVQKADWHAAIAHARTLPGADPQLEAVRRIVVADQVSFLRTQLDKHGTSGTA